MRKALAAAASTAAGFAAVLGLHTVSPRNNLLNAASSAGPTTTTTVPQGQGGTGSAKTGGKPSPPSPSTTFVVPSGTRSAVGPSEQYGYGVLSVKVTVSGTKITDLSLAGIQVAESYSQMLAQQVVPMLRQEVLSAQNARVNGVSGATYTSEAYLYSAQAALDKLHLPA